MDLTIYIGLKTELQEQKAVAHTEADEDLHITLVYGTLKDTDLPAKEVEKRILEVVEGIADQIPEEVVFDTTGRFDASESSDGEDVIYAHVKSGQLEDLREEVIGLLKHRGIDPEFDFDEYIPHMTLGYVEPGLDFRPKKLNLMAKITEAVYCAAEKEKDAQSADRDTEFAITKSDEDQHLVFGWASVAERTNGTEVCDVQGDMVSPEELEKAAYEYVLNWHTGGEEHIPELQDKCRMVESVVFTREKLQAMGIPEGIVPLGWWIGFKVDDENAWQMIKNGTYRMFSIAGRGKRVPVDEYGSESF